MFYIFFRSNIYRFGFFFFERRFSILSHRLLFLRFKRFTNALVQFGYLCLQFGQLVHFRPFTVFVQHLEFLYLTAHACHFDDQIVRTGIQRIGNLLQPRFTGSESYRKRPRFGGIGLSRFLSVKMEHRSGITQPLVHLQLHTRILSYQP